MPLADPISPAVLAGDIAASVHDAERSIDMSLIRIGVLLQSLPEARLASGLSAFQGQGALEALAEAAQDGVRMRGNVVRVHKHLSREGRRLNVDVATMTGGLQKPADDGTIETTRPQGRLVDAA